MDPFETLRGQFTGDPLEFDEDRCRSEVARRLVEGDFRLLVAVDQDHVQALAALGQDPLLGELGKDLAVSAAVKSPKPLPAKGWPHFDATLLADPESRARFFGVLSDLVAEVGQSQS